MKPDNSIQALIFDFGNVIINIDFDKMFHHFRKLMGKDYNLVMQRWQEDNFQRKVEVDTFSAEKMTGLINSYGTKLTVQEVEHAWNSLLLDIPVKRIELLESLSKQFPLYLLSNTNYVHINKIFRDLETEYNSNILKPFFEMMFLSYEIGFIKPEIEIYQYVLEHIPYNAENCLFFDDMQKNLDGAEKLGFQTQLVTKDYGILEFFEDYSNS